MKEEREKRKWDKKLEKGLKRTGKRERRLMKKVEKKTLGYQGRRDEKKMKNFVLKTGTCSCILVLIIKVNMKGEKIRMGV